MDEITTHDELAAAVDAVIDYMSEHEDIFYVSFDAAYQLRDEIARILSDAVQDED